MFKQFTVAISSFALTAKGAGWGNSMTSLYYRAFMGSGNLGTSFIGGGDDKGHGQSLPSFLFKDSFGPP